MGLNRRGIFLSLSAVLAIGVLFVVFAPTTQRELVQESRVQVQDTVARVTALETQELGAWVTYITRQTLNELAREPPLSDQQSVPDLFRSRVLQFREMSPDQPGTHLDTLGEIEQFYREQFNYEGFSLSLTDISLRSGGFRSVLVTADFDVFLVDESNSLRIERTLQVQQLVPLEGLVDPLALRLNAPHDRIRFAQRTIRTSDDFFEHARTGTYVATNSSFPGIPYFERFKANPQVSRTDSIHFLFPPGHFSETRSYVDYYPALQDPCVIGLQDPDDGAWIYLDALILPFYGIGGFSDLQTTVSDSC